MRTRTDYACECGHTGYSILAENDQPFSTPWERLTCHGFDLDKPLAEVECPACGTTGQVRIHPR